MTDNNKKTHLIVTGRGGGGTQVQADWSQSDNTQPDYIKNKPELATVATTGDYDDLQNKPTIPAAPVQSDWNESDTTSLAYINNKPAIPAAQVNSDWNANSGVAQILNKPTIPTVPAMATQELTFTLQDGTVKKFNFYIEPNYFYIEDISGSDNTLSITKYNSNAPTVEVFSSRDRVNWTSMGTTSTTAITATVPANGKLYLKATANLWGGENLACNRISCTGNHNVGGNTMSLLYGDNFENQTTFPTNNTNVLSSLFNENNKLVDASNLELPATTLVGYCYDLMFRNCTSLTTAPALPATTLGGSCYEQMFNGCTSLTQAPELPATTLTTFCYNSMFSGCTSLNEITTYANDISAVYCISNWLSNVAASGTFHNEGTATYTVDSPSGIPTGWTEHTSL